MNSDKISSFRTLSGEFFNSLPESIRSYIRYLEATIQQLEACVHELEARLSKDCSNSIKPPGSDGLKKKKTKSQRGKSGKNQERSKGMLEKVWLKLATLIWSLLMHLQTAMDVD